MIPKWLAVVVASSLLGLNAAVLLAQCRYNCTAYSFCLQADVECKYCNPVGWDGSCDGVEIDFNPANLVLQEAEYGGNFDITLSKAICYRSRVCIADAPISFKICFGNGSDCVDGFPYVCVKCALSPGVPIEEWIENVTCIPCAL